MSWSALERPSEACAGVGVVFGGHSLRNRGPPRTHIGVWIASSGHFWAALIWRGAQIGENAWLVTWCRLCPPAGRGPGDVSPHPGPDGLAPQLGKGPGWDAGPVPGAAILAAARPSSRAHRVPCDASISALRVPAPAPRSDPFSLPYPPPASVGTAGWRGRSRGFSREERRGLWRRPSAKARSGGVWILCQASALGLGAGRRGSSSLGSREGRR